MTLTFADIRKGPEPVVIKSYDFNGSNVIISNEQSIYVATVDGININDDGFDNILDAETSAKELIELLHSENN